MNHDLRNNPRIMEAAAALFQHGRRSPHYIRAIRSLNSQDRALVQFASPEQVMAVRAALGVHPAESR